MKIYIAGNTIISTRERMIFEVGGRNRLASYFYLIQAIIKDQWAMTKQVAKESKCK
jgi:hypothetical protein